MSTKRFVCRASGRSAHLYRSRALASLGLAVVILAGLLWAPAASAAPGDTTLASHAAGAPLQTGNAASYDGSISADGRYVVFESEASDLVSGDSNGLFDIFLYDRVTGAVTLISHAFGSAGSADSSSFDPAISDDGNWVVFESYATDLVSGQVDANDLIDLFLWSRVSNATTLVTHAPASLTQAADGEAGWAVISADGGFIAFVSDADDQVAGQVVNNDYYDVFLFSRTTGEVVLVSHAAGLPADTGNGSAENPSISADGAFVAYESHSEDLVAGQVDGNGSNDVFLFARATGANALVSHAPGSATNTGNGFAKDPKLSADGNFVAFESDASNLVVGSDTNGDADVFLFSRSSSAVTLVSHVPANPTTAGNAASFLLDDNSQNDAQISADGEVVGFTTDATDLSGGSDGNGGEDAFLYTRSNGIVLPLSHVPGSLAAGNDESFAPVVSADGQVIAFETFASDLGGNDANGSDDVYRYTRATGARELISHAGANPVTTANGHSYDPFLSADGSVAVFQSEASNVVTGQNDANGSGSDIFIAELGLAASLSVDDVTLAEGDAGTTTFTFTITRSGNTLPASSVDWSTADGSAVAPSDYTAVGPTTVNFAAGEITKTVSVNVNGDTSIEANDGFTVNLSNPANAVIGDGTGVGRIINDDGAAFSVGDVTVTEGDSGTSLATFTVSRTGDIGDAATVQWRTLDVHATANGDYVAVPLTTLGFGAGETTKQVSVVVNGDTTFEPTEDFYVRLSNPTGLHTLADATGLGTITNDDAALSISDATVAEGNAGTSLATFTVTRAGDTSDAGSVQWFTMAGTATAGEDFVAVAPTTLDFAAGEASKTVSVTINGDTAVEANETFVVRLSSPVNASIADNSGLGRISNDDNAAFSVGDATVTEGNAGTTTATFTVTRLGAAGGTATVQWSTADGTATAGGGDYVAAGATTLTFGPGDTTKQVTVTVNGDAAKESNETFQVRLTSPVGAALADGSGLGRITNDD